MTKAWRHGWLYAVGCGLCVNAAVAQGPLEPPDPPGPAMKTLAQVEPRTPVTSGDVITEPGSYYLTGNLTATGGQAGVTIEANKVTLDLCGYTIEGDGTAAGVTAAASLRDLAIRNGMVSRCSYGLNVGSVTGCRVTQVHAVSNGVTGITVGRDAAVQDCSSRDNGVDGFMLGADSRIWNCSSSGNGDDGVEAAAGSLVASCLATRNSYGVYVGENATVRNCALNWNGTHGALGGNRCVVESCTLHGNGSSGIAVSSDCRIEGNHCELNNSAGIASGSGCRIWNNVCVGAPVGIDLKGSGCDVAGNRVMGNTDNYDLAAGNHLRLLLGEVPEVLDWPCHVTLAGTLTCTDPARPAIDVRADNVTIDLGGHALTGAGALGNSGIAQQAGRHGLVVYNGTVSGFGDAGNGGIVLAGRGGRVRDVLARENWYGFDAPAGSDDVTFTRCSAVDNVADGFQCAGAAVLDGCVAVSNAVMGFDLGDGAVVSGCSASHNGTEGISLGIGGVIKGCSAVTNGGAGILAGQGSTITDCSASRNLGTGIDAAARSTIARCTAYENVAYGIRGRDGGTIQDCTAGENGDGFRAEARVNISHCLARGNTRHGIHGSEYNTVANCQASQNGDISNNGAGILVWQGARVEANTAINNYLGFQAAGVRNLFARNSAVNNTTNYVIANLNAVGTIVVTPMSPAIQGSSGGSGLGSTDPWSNFSH